MAEINLLTGNLFTIGQFASADRPDDLKVASASHTFTPTQSVIVKQHPVRLTVQHILTLTSAARKRNIVLEASDYLELHDGVTRPKALSAINFLQLVHSTRTVLHQQLQQTLGLVQSVNVTRGLNNRFVLNQVLGYHIIKNLEVNQVFNLRHGVSVYFQNRPNAVIASAVSPLGFLAIVLTGFGQSVTLSVPEFGDTDSIQPQRIIRETRAGTRIVYKDPIWPIVEVLKFSFKNLSQYQAKQLLSFFDTTLGKTVNLTDHNGVIWEGIVSNPDASIKEEQASNCGGFAVDLEFEGKRL